MRHGGEEVILETTGLLGAFFGHLRLNRRDDQALVRFAQLEVELFDFQLGPNHFFRGTDGLLAQPHRLFPGSHATSRRRSAFCCELTAAPPDGTFCPVPPDELIAGFSLDIVSMVVQVNGAGDHVRAAGQTILRSGRASCLQRCPRR
jgi:hypothetical protein